MDNQGLKRNLMRRHVELISIGGIIGSCYFLGTGYVVQNVGPAVSLSYIFGGVIIFIVMYSLCELAVVIPVSGSFITYSALLISPSWACATGWTYWLNWIAYIPAECTACGIIMHSFISDVSVFQWSLFFGFIITLVNLSDVKDFGEIEFWLAIIKIAALLLFSVLAVLIFLGILKNSVSGGFIGLKYLYDDGGFFPKGKWIIMTTMVMLLVNFEGSEIIGLAAGESINPEKTIPIASRNIVLRIVVLYLVPVFLLTLIFPWDKAGMTESIFGAALESYELKWGAEVFTFVVLTAAMSCANSGMYGAVRALHGLANEGMAPRLLKTLNKNQVPANATFVTLFGVWVFLALSALFSSTTAFAALLSISGFTGTICWITICWAQYSFRKLLRKKNYSASGLKFRVPWPPIVTLIGIIFQVSCLLLLLFDSDLRPAFYFGIPAMILPMIIYKLCKKKYQHKIEVVLSSEKIKVIIAPKD